jgi:hypothetical protein
MAPTGPTKLFFLVSVLIFTSLACKCIDDKRRWIKDAPMTEFCCRHMYGNAWLTKGPGVIDCEAWSIQNELANFSDCCGGGKRDYISDCSGLLLLRLMRYAYRHNLELLGIR